MPATMAAHKNKDVFPFTFFFQAAIPREDKMRAAPTACATSCVTEGFLEYVLSISSTFLPYFSQNGGKIVANESTIEYGFGVRIVIEELPSSVLRLIITVLLSR